MSAVKSVLLVPNKNGMTDDPDPIRLVAEGACGYRPPLAVLTQGGWRACAPGEGLEGHRAVGLVLAWSGQVHTFGCHHAFIMATWNLVAGPRYLSGFFSSAARGFLDPAQDYGQVRSIQKDPRWRVVLLDDAGQEVAER
jgi:hypothetical protein